MQLTENYKTRNTVQITYFICSWISWFRLNFILFDETHHHNNKCVWRLVVGRTERIQCKKIACNKLAGLVVLANLRLYARYKSDCSGYLSDQKVYINLSYESHHTDASTVVLSSRSSSSSTSLVVIWIRSHFLVETKKKKEKIISV